MKLRNFFLGVTLGVGIAVAGFSVSINFWPKNSNSFPASSVPAEANSAYQSQTDDQGEISVEVTPQSLGAAAPWEFVVSLDTHSGDLAEDLVKQSTLNVLTPVGESHNFKPIAWMGPGPGGHHRSGTLIFETVSPLPRSVTLRIAGVGGVPEREFKWELK